ncbi:hypothetical protein Taro_029655 [Colocasia esculenta]|uniref:Uncharacterized protein n=1 Tax=Colocasia esculenta TaxID=4460 RepID=A0A843VXU4_COLES|nr:hypothetical protein [Colocasia esculenta]
MEVWTWVEDKTLVDAPDRLTSGNSASCLGGVLPVCVASRVVVTSCRFYEVSDRGVFPYRATAAGRAPGEGDGAVVVVPVDLCYSPSRSPDLWAVTTKIRFSA